MSTEKIVDYRQMLDNFPVVTMRLSYKDSQWETWYVSKNVSAYGYSWEDFMEGKVTWIDMVHPDDRVVLNTQIREYLAHNIDDFKLQYRIVTKQGGSIWITEYTHFNRDASGQMYCMDSILLNTTQAKLGQDMLDEHYKQQLVLNDILMALHDSDLEHALQIILDRAGAYLDTSRALLFKDSEDHITCKVEYEWLNKGITSVKSLDYAITYSTGMPEIYVALQETGLLIVNAGEIPENCREEFESEGLVASAIFAVYLNGQHYGFVCFDDCVIERKWNEDTVNFLKNISNLISTVLMRKYTVEQVERTQKTCETVLDNVDSYIFATDPYSGRIIFANTAFKDDFGADCIGQRSSRYLDFGQMGPPEGPAPLLPGHGRGDYGPYSREIFSEKNNKWLAASWETIKWIDGQQVHLVTCYDVTTKKQYEEKIKRLAFLDHLTGLPNRYRCDVDLKAAIEAARKAWAGGYVLFIDMDDFKIVNDCYGHDYGDGVLIAFAGFLRDLVGGNGSVFRFGGDEFVILIPHDKADNVDYFLKAMLDRASRPWPSLDKEFYCTLSIGVVPYGKAADEDVKGVLKRADIAMYQAKKMGKNSVAYYREGLDSAAIARSEMEHLLRRAMQNNYEGFELFYQPYIDVASRRIIGAETLLRMRDGSGNLLLPEEFITLAEYLGFIVPLGEHILEQAAIQCKRVNDAGQPDFTITVNLAVRQFKQKNLVTRLEEILKRTGVNFSNIIIGINERVAIGELERMLMVCGELRKKGLQVVLDDFGSGNASFINLRTLPVDMIKVSPEFIRDIDDPFTGKLLKLVVDLGHSTHKAICLNGVENEAQYEFCRLIGADVAQGFLFHYPEPVAVLNEIV